VAALCVRPQSAYHRMAGVECYDIKRDVRNFVGGMPIVAHPPRGPWGAVLSPQAKPLPGERALGFLCADLLLVCGGVLAHPAHSRLFAAAGLPLPGCTVGDLTTIEVQQAWRGLPVRNPTWLCLCRVTPPPVPCRDPDSRSGAGDTLRSQRMSLNQRSATTTALAQWLVNTARSATERDEI
jgi:hypothetical protein